MTITISTDGSALGNPNAEPSNRQPSGLTVGEVSGRAAGAREGAIRIKQEAHTL